MNTLSFRLLGTPDIRLGDRPVNGFVSSKAQALLIYLAVTQRRWNRASLATLFWGDLSETAARRSLTKILSNLRQLVDGYLVIDRHTIALSPDKAIWLDVTDFAQKLTAPATDPVQWQAAVAIYGGDFLQGFHVANAPDFEEWLRTERERLRLQCCAALARLSNHAAYAKYLSQAIAWSQQLLRLEPTDEKTHRQLMMLFVRNGQRNSALAQYAACREIVERELDVEPAPATAALYQQILNGHPESPTADAVVHTSPLTVIAKPLPPPARLIGREQEWQRLLALGQQTLANRPHFCLILGEAGQGKTRLAEEMLGWVAENDIPAARTRAYAAAGELAYAPIVDWLRSPPLQPALATLDEIWLKEIARLLPELAQEHPQWHPQTAPDGPWQRQRLFDALTRAFQAGPRPKVLLLDDLQWCDSETAAWLHYFLQTSQQAGTNGQPIALTFIVGTARPEILHAGHPLHTALLHLRSDGHMTELDLAPLDAAASAALASQTTIDELTPTQVENLFNYTEGNPLFIIESVRSETWRVDFAAEDIHSSAPLPNNVTNEWTVPPSSRGRLGGGLPPKMQAVIQARLAQLSPNARTLAGLAAVIGRSFSWALLQKASADTHIDAVAGLDELWQQGLVRAHGHQQYDFSHDRIREVAYLGVSPVQRPLWHDQAAHALTEVNAADLTPVSAQLAFHYEQAGDWERAIEYYQVAAKQAHAIFADADTVALLRRARELLVRLPDTRHRQEVELSILLQMREPIPASEGFTMSLGEICARAIFLCEALGESRHLLQALDGLRSFYHMRARYVDARAAAEQLIALTQKNVQMAGTQSAEGDRLVAIPHHRLGTTLLYQGELLAAQESYQRSFSEGGFDVGLFIFLALALWLRGYPNQARHNMLKAWVEARNQKIPHLQGFVLANLARLNHFLRCAPQTQIWAKKTIALCSTAYEIPFWPRLGRFLLGNALASQGHFNAGIALIQADLRQAEADQHNACRTYYISLLAEAHAYAGQYTEALADLDMAMEFVERNGERFWQAELVRLSGECLLALGAPPDEVTACYQEAIEIAQGQQAKSLELRAGHQLGPSLSAAGR